MLEKFTADLGRGEIRLEPDSIKALQSYSWPGNVRELRNVIERAVLLSDQPNIKLRDLHFDGHSHSRQMSLDSSLTLMDMERQHIERVLREESGRVEKTAKRLGIPRSSLYQKIKKHRINVSKV
jgi:DNA-binding NtrC family response regulator